MQRHNVRSGSRRRHDRGAHSELGQFAQRISFHAEVVTDHVKTFFTNCGKIVRLFSRDDARELAVFHRRRLAGLRDYTCLVEIDGRKTSAHRSLVANVAHESARVDAFDGDDVPSFQIRLETFFGAPV